MKKIVIIVSLSLFVGCNQAEKKPKKIEVKQQAASSILSENNGDWTILFDGSSLDNWRGYLSCLLYTSPSPRDKRQSRMPSSA